MFSTQRLFINNKQKNSCCVVLVHCGSAFEKWVTKWNDVGFTAISIAVEGQKDQRHSDKS
jgi:hypothetical protein